MKTAKGLEGKVCEESLRSHGLFWPEEDEGRPEAHHGGLQLPTGSRGAAVGFGFGWCCGGPGVGLGDPCGSFQLRIVCDSMIHRGTIKILH